MLFGFFFLVVQIAAIKAATEPSPQPSPAPSPVAPSPPVPVCLLESGALSGCLSGNNANAACQACLSGATDQLDPLETDTCYSLSTRVCSYLKNPSCLCPLRHAKSKSKSILVATRRSSAEIWAAMTAWLVGLNAALVTIFALFLTTYQASLQGL